MKTEIKMVDISPEFAADLLQRNKNNRNVRERQVEALVEAMKKGEWELSNDAIVVSEGGLLLNGQHRLMAVVKSGITCPFILFTGASDSSFDIMDTPTIRRVSDVIQRKGGTNTIRSEAAIGRFINLCYDYDRNWTSALRFQNEIGATRKSKIAAYEKHQDNLNKWLRLVSNILLNGIPIASITLLTGFALFLETRMHHPEEKIIAFLRELCIDGVAKNTTILCARRKLLRHKTKVEVLPRYDDFRLIIRAWNDFVLGKQVQSIKTLEDSFRYIKPV